MAVKFEELKESHLESILAIEPRVHASPWSRRAFENELINPHSLFLVTFLDEEVIGYGGVWNVVDEAHVTTIAISPDFQRKGYGRALMVELLNRAKQAGQTCSTLEVRVSNAPAIKLYHDLGYEDAAVRKRYYPDNNEDALIMWLYRLQEWEFPRVV